MRSMKCWECGRGAEPPLTIARPVDETETLPEFAICPDCLARIREDSDGARELEDEIRTGSVCALCLRDLDPPGGYTVWTIDKTHLVRLCAACKERVERDRFGREA